VNLTDACSEDAVRSIRQRAVGHASWIALTRPWHDQLTIDSERSVQTLGEAERQLRSESRTNLMRSAWK
jgi:hypothetical protein